VALAALLAAASAATAWWEAALPAVLALDLAFLAAVLADRVTTPAPARFEVERDAPETAPLSGEVEREVILRAPRSRFAAGLAIALHEEFPATFEVVSRTVDGDAAPPAAGDPSGGPDTGRLDAAGMVRLARVYRPRLRGAHALGDVRLRVRGPLGLVDRQRRLRGTQVIAVEPALADLRNTLRLAASERWRDLGVRRLRRRGGASEFESLRDYVHGDDPRRVDWKAFARRGKPMVRQYQEERGQELVLLVDCGRRMRAVATEGARAGWTKLDWALDAGLQLAAVALARGDRVGALAFDERLRAYVAPARSAVQLRRLRDALFHLLPSAAESDLERALRELAARHRRRALVVVVSDVADPLSAHHQRRALGAASRRHRVIFAALDDPEVRALAEAGAAGGDGGAAADAPTRAAAYQLQEDRRRALRELRSQGVRVLDALPAEAAGPMLAAWLDERRRG
jgi:uncharacterized protein (DUF58 family)